MKSLAEKILKQKVLIIVCFIILTIVNLFLATKVKTNYNLAEYLPNDVKSIIAAEKVIEEYQIIPPNLKIVIPDVTINESISYKAEILKVAGVNEVLWLDNYIDFNDSSLGSGPLPETLLNDWYRDQNALLLINIDEADAVSIVKEIRSVVKADSLFAGDVINIISSQEDLGQEMSDILLLVVPIILVILLLTTGSWFEPILFLLAITVAIIINLGTNLIFGEISFITQAAVAILQLAVSMDYAIFLLHRFTAIRNEGKTVEKAMVQAMRDSFSVIIGSALTTILGFIALTFMRFKIGFDLGLVLAKGITLSFLAVMILLPVLAVLTYKIIEKTKHRSFIPSFQGIGKITLKCRYVILVIVLLLIVPSFIGSQQNDFIYGSSGIDAEGSKVYDDLKGITDIFGYDNKLTLLVPKGNLEQELELVTTLNSWKEVMSISSFVTTFGLETPIAYLPTEMVKSFIGENYSQIIINVDLPIEGKETFAFIEDLEDEVSVYYDDYYLAGVSATNYDMMQTITQDNLRINIMAIISILLVLILIFKSLLIPIILIITIEVAIWINLSITYLYGIPLNYIGFLIVSIVQLGATVDYAILFAKNYRDKRQITSKQEAALLTITETAPSILSSAFILGIAGFGLGFISTNSVISQLGTLMGRGALISALMVLLFTPALLMLCDFRFKKEKGNN